MIVDYFLIRRGNVYLDELFSRSSSGRYFYFHGFNLRAFAAFVIGFLLPLPGFVASFGYDISAAASHMYALGWVLSFLMGCLSYYVICLIWKVPGNEPKLPFESRAADAETLDLEGLSVVGSTFEKHPAVAHSKEAHSDSQLA